MSTASPRGRNSESVEDILAEMDGMVGLDHVKTQLRQFIALARVMVLRRDRDLPTPRISLHMVFSGPPGTGKTVMARKVGRLLRAVRLLTRGHCVEVDRSDLVAQYVGQTAARTREVVDKALDGVLFIDEAYMLTKQSKQQGGMDPFGQEAVDTLVAQMENYRERLVVIIAGYTDDIRDFVASNAGLKSRFSRYIDFESYSGDQLVEIFMTICEENRVVLSDEAKRTARQTINQIAQQNRTAKDFGNARVVRTFFETVLVAQAERLSREPDVEGLSDDAMQRIEREDIAVARDIRDQNG
ncbi:MAG: AAA family ATPase [Zoogloeaceae bacterium]|nr:AAA family ATPase [Zoogloeaceae bacterium]